MNETAMPTRQSTTDRGYGATHQAARTRYARTVAAGNAICARCHRRIRPDEPWDLGHTDDRTGYQGPEHRYCNRAAGARNSKTSRTTTKRAW